MSKKSNKRPWRKLLKKLQRKGKRQKLAGQRDKNLEDAETQKLQDSLYKSWLEQQATIERQKQQEEENERQEQEELWLRRELIAQKQFKIDKLKREALEAKEEAERLKQEEELRLKEETRSKKREEIKLQAEKAAKEFDAILTNMQVYLDDPTMKTPTRLLINVESRPGEKFCEFYEKTNCCRFDPVCSFNHKRPILAKIIIIKHFFQHPLLGQQEHEEYSRSDSELELSERDLRDAYDEFCEDVWPVLEEFGSILNFRTVRNVHAHLRGHVFVEYVEKRSALKAFINLQNRYYASKRLNVEFSNIIQWHKAVCGMRSFFKGLSLGRKCPKGDKCNYLHLMKNVSNKYNQAINNPERSLRNFSLSTKSVLETPATSWNAEVNRSSAGSRDWRWSESPEIEIKNNAKYTENKNDPPTTSHSSQRKHTKCGSISSSPYLANYRKSRSSSRYTDLDEFNAYKKNSPYNSLGGSRSSSPNQSYNKSSKKSGSSSRYKDYDKSYKRRSKSRKRYHKSEHKSSETDANHSKKEKSKIHKNSKFSSLKESCSPVSRNHKKLKRSKSKSSKPGKKRKKSSIRNKDKSPHR